jgi:hypothetical protein
MGLLLLTILDSWAAERNRNILFLASFYAVLVLGFPAQRKSILEFLENSKRFLSVRLNQT